MTTLQEALPCPFCGKQHTLQVISGQELMGEDQEFWQHSESFGVVCDASSPDGKGGCGAMGGFKPTEDEAIEAWNTRSALAQQAATKNCPQPEICGSKECEFCRDTAAPAPQAQQMEPTDDQLVKGVKAMRLFVTKNSVADFKLGYMAALAAAPAPQAQPVAQPLSDDEILTIVHRKATRYTHAVAPGQVTYGFTVAHLLDFANSIREVK